jgi:hypothetical protein
LEQLVLWEQMVSMVQLVLLDLLDLLEQPVLLVLLVLLDWTVSMLQLHNTQLVMSLLPAVGLLHPLARGLHTARASALNLAIQQVELFDSLAEQLHAL